MAKKTGMPTWVGAWMPGNYNNGNHYSIQEQCNFAKFMVSEITKADIPFAINSYTKYYDRTTNTWITKMHPIFKTIFTVSKTFLGSGFNVKATRILKNVSCTVAEGNSTLANFIEIQ